MADGVFRILSLDGGGAKGFYTLGVLREIEAVVGKPLCEHFDLIYGTSTGSIIASLLGIGKTVDEVIALYDEHVVKIVGRFWPWNKSAALRELTAEVFGDLEFDAFKTNMGIVTTRWIEGDIRAWFRLHHRRCGPGVLFCLPVLHPEGSYHESRGDDPPDRWRLLREQPDAVCARRRVRIARD